MFCDDTMICPTTMMKTIYENYKIKNKITDGGDTDKFMYIYMASETTFG